MTKEFNLSEKIELLDEWIRARDVKEFINRLKVDLNKLTDLKLLNPIQYGRIMAMINALAGDKIK